MAFREKIYAIVALSAVFIVALFGCLMVYDWVVKPPVVKAVNASNVSFDTSRHYGIENLDACLAAVGKEYPASNSQDRWRFCWQYGFMNPVHKKI